MADNTTVQTTPEPRQSHDVGEWILIPEGLTTELSPAGVKVEIMRGEREFPEDWDCVDASIALHKDGSHCTAECGCVGKNSLTAIRCGETVAIGDWTWVTYDAPWIVGWRRTGPSDAEKVLREKLMKAFGERDEARAERDRATEDFENAHVLCDADLERAKKDGRRRRRTLVLASAVGWGAAIALSVTLTLILAGVIG